MFCNLKVSQLKHFGVCVCVAVMFAGSNYSFAQKVITVGDYQIEEIWITMKDGTKLAADKYTLKANKGKRLPVVLEYIPYRKDQGRPRSLSTYSYFLDREYIFVRVDIRGSGRSEGKVVDGEYSEQEQLDGEEIIDYLSKQKYSNGSVAMFGISWGGFNGLHMAMRKPKALKTIITMMSTDDIYEDDVHFMDGIMHVDAYELMMDIDNIVPGNPEYKIGEDYFKNRFDTEPWLLKYKRQQVDGPFWDRASLNTDFTAIDIPVFVVGGYYDGYRDFVPKMIQNADVPVKAILGPWNHSFPHSAYPEPAIEWREMAVRWLDQWCRGEDTGILDEPSVYYYQRDWHAPGLDLEEIPGSWYTSDKWPETVDSLLYLNQNFDLVATPNDFKHSLAYNPSAGIEGSGSVMWWGDWAPDQKSTDAQSLVYDSKPMSEDLEIVGFPHLTLQTSVDAPAANWIVRMSDVAPNGQVTLITGAGFNANHVESSAKPIQLESGKRYEINIELHVASWTFEKGHKVRVSINNAQWPMFWPSQYNMTSTIWSDDKVKSVFKLPVLKNPTPMKKPFPKPASGPIMEGYKSLAYETLSGYAEIKEIIRNPRTKTTTLIATNSSSDQYPWAIHHSSDSLVYTLSDNDPAHCSAQSTYSVSIEQAGRFLNLKGILSLTSDEKTFYYRYKRILEENGKVIRVKEWKEDIPRAW
jgi:uncharacterized protein